MVRHTQTAKPMSEREFNSHPSFQSPLNTSFLLEAFDCGQGLSAHSVNRSRMVLASGILVIWAVSTIFRAKLCAICLLDFFPKCAIIVLPNEREVTPNERIF